MSQLTSLVDLVLSSALPVDCRHAIGVREPKIVRDAVWGMVHLHPHEVLIIDTPLFQRLRGIFQTGFTYMVYPCATHSRFEHSLGCMHLAGKVIEALRRLQGRESPVITPELIATVRLAALLHDVSHCIFSHVSETVYKRDERIKEAKEGIRHLFHSSEQHARVGAAEVLAYYILTSARFGSFFAQVRRAVTEACLPTAVSPENIARLIIGLPPKENQTHAFAAQIINGPFDVDKMDYQTRDGYFTGVTTRVDVERLLVSLCVAQDNRGKYFLATDHRGIAPIEQLLFNRMLLYDSVYHHHKIRAAVQLFESCVDGPVKLPLEWLLRHDEYDFYGGKDVPKELHKLIDRLRRRDLPQRCAIIHPATINHPSAVQDSVWMRVIEKLFSTAEIDVQKARDWLDGVKAKMRERLNVAHHGRFYLDIPQPPKYITIQQGAQVMLSPDHVVTLDDVFPINAAISSYAQQCKYRVYLFAEADARIPVAAAAYRAFKDSGVQLNEDAFRLAKLDPREVGQAANETVPEHQFPE